VVRDTQNNMCEKTCEREPTEESKARAHKPVRGEEELERPVGQTESRQRGFQLREQRLRVSVCIENAESVKREMEERGVGQGIREVFPSDGV
jgi:hypothetical protein